MAEPGEAVRLAAERLPGWVPWLPVVAVPVVVLVTQAVACALAYLALAHELRATRGAHWTERARRTLTPRHYLALITGLGVYWAWFGTQKVWTPFAALERRWIFLLTVVVVLAGQVVVRRRMAERLFPGRYSLVEWLRSLVVWVVFFQPTLWIALALWIYLPVHLGVLDGVVLVAGVALAFVAATGRGLFALEWLGIARPASERLARIVERCSRESGVRVRGVHEVPIAMANAFAMPFLGRVVVSERLIAALDDEELAAVVHHELGHLAEPRRLLAARMVPPAVIVLLGTSTPILGVLGVIGTLALVVGALAAALLLRRVFRRAEEGADEHAHEHSADESVHARGLEKIYADNLVPAVMRRGTHPSLYDRMTAAGLEPEYARPAAPSAGFLVRLAGALAILVLVAPFFGPFGAGLALQQQDTWREAELALALAHTGSGAVGGPEVTSPLVALARLEATAGDAEGARVFLLAALEIGPPSFRSAALLAGNAGELGACAEARAALKEAEGMAHRAEGAAVNAWLDWARASVEQCEETR